MSHDASHAADTDERHIVGDIIAHLLIGAWLASVGVNLLLRSINSRRISSAFNTPKSALFPSASGACFWLFLAGYQIAIALVRGLLKPTWRLILQSVSPADSLQGSH